MRRPQIDFARQLRGDPTPAERLLWRHLRRRGLDGARFRRQHPVGPFVVDFVCLERGLVVELDGGQHADPEELRRDAERTQVLAERGFRVLRFWNSQVLTETNAVLEVIFASLVEARIRGSGS